MLNSVENNQLFMEHEYCGCFQLTISIFLHSLLRNVVLRPDYEVRGIYFISFKIPPQSSP